MSASLPPPPPDECYCCVWPCLIVPGFMSFLIGLFGGVWTSISLFNLLSYQKDNVYRRLLRQSGQQCTGRIVRKYKKRVRSGKSHRTAYMIDTRFTTMQSVSMSGRFRRERTIVQELEIAQEAWEVAGEGDTYEMCYLPMMPTICKMAGRCQQRPKEYTTCA